MVRIVFETLPIRQPIIEFGSRQVRSQESVAKIMLTLTISSKRMVSYFEIYAIFITRDLVLLFVRFKAILRGTLENIKKIHLFSQRPYQSPETEHEIATLFNQLYYDAHVLGKTWADTRFFGTPVQQSVSDLWVYQEIIYERRPDVIVECGTHAGGCALYLASLCELVRKGTVLSIDTTEVRGRPQHERITYLTGSSTSDSTLKSVKESTAKADRVMVLLDSDHKKDHVLEELRNYGQFVTVADYMIVEDTNLNGHPVLPEFGPGPMEAVQDFLAENDSFVIDVGREKFFLTFNPRGYLKKIK